VEQVRTRTSILFFAEGTRSTDGRLRPFKKGAAILAIDAQVPLVPLAVAGAHEITPKGGLWVHSGRPLVLRVGKPIPTAGLTRDDRDSLTEQAHDAVAALLEEGNRRVEEMLRT
jgi:1-acyl-sn-glycerol-3-phosphate acyltransferase